jgi:transcriptional regulator with XRE-family HTH domain
MISGKELRLLRLSSGQSQAELAKKLGNGGYDAKIVSAIENDRRKIGLGLLADWSDACGYNVSVTFHKQGALEDESISDIELPVDFEGDL